MKRILLTLVLLYTTFVQSQEKIFEKEVSKISKSIEKITKQQKDSLKAKVIAIDKQLDIEPRRGGGYAPPAPASPPFAHPSDSDSDTDRRGGG